MAEFRAQTTHDHFMEEKGSTDTVIGLLEVNEGSVERMDHVFGLINEGICNKYVVGASTPIGEGSLEWVGHVGICHELH